MGPEQLCNSNSRSSDAGLWLLQGWAIRVGLLLLLASRSVWLWRLRQRRILSPTSSTLLAKWSLDAVSAVSGQPRLGQSPWTESVCWQPLSSRAPQPFAAASSQQHSCSLEQCVQLSLGLTLALACGDRSLPHCASLVSLTRRCSLLLLWCSSKQHPHRAWASHGELCCCQMCLTSDPDVRLRCPVHKRRATAGSSGLCYANLSIPAVQCARGQERTVLIRWPSACTRRALAEAGFFLWYSRRLAFLDAIGLNSLSDAFPHSILPQGLHVFSRLLDEREGALPLLQRYPHHIRNWFMGSHGDAPIGVGNVAELLDHLLMQGQAK